MIGRRKFFAFVGAGFAPLASILAAKPVSAEPFKISTWDRKPAKTPDTLLPCQRLVMEAPEREVLFLGGHGAGKSYVLREWLNREDLRCSLEFPVKWAAYSFVLCSKLTAEQRKQILSLAIDNAEELREKDYIALFGLYPNARVLLAAHPSGPGAAWLRRRFDGQDPSRRLIHAGSMQRLRGGGLI